MLNALLIATLTSTGQLDQPDSSANKNVPLDEIVVTDFKQNKRNLTSTAVSTINVQQLHNQQIVNLKELTAVMPNFYMPDYGSYANTPVYIRGIGTKSKGSAVGFMLTVYHILNRQHSILTSATLLPSTYSVVHKGPYTGETPLQVLSMYIPITLLTISEHV